MKEEFYIVEIEDDIEASDFLEIIKLSKEDYDCDGHEEFSLDEEEVDKILGDEAFCGGDLSESLMEKLENEATKDYKFYFTGDEAMLRAESFKNFLVKAGVIKIKVLSKPIEDWNETWKKHYKPIDLGRFLIIPVWEVDNFKESNRDVIVINPGMGFGTGTHETTRQCLLSLLSILDSDEIMNDCLDFGSGSGILGIGFQKICNGQVDYVDIDLNAIENNKNNVSLNFTGIKDQSKYILRSEFEITKKYDLVFANILEHVLEDELEVIQDCVKPEKILIVSGLLLEQKDNIVNKYGKYFKLIRELKEGDWMALTFRKK